ncbi:hypothetical protein ACHAXT_003931 [Thalassiosira profunda]
MASSTPNGLDAALSKTNDVAAASLRRAIRQHAQNGGYDARTDGLDFLQAKNGLMLSYLIDLTVLMRCRLQRSSLKEGDGGGDPDGGDSDGDGSTQKQSQPQQEAEECLARLLETKTALEKLRPLEKKMRYQIDKLLALATLGAGTFAGAGREEEEEEEEREIVGKTGGIMDVAGDGEDGEEGKAASDPLSFKPDLSGMMQMFQEDGDEANGDEKDSSGDSDIGDDDDKPSRPQIALEKDDAPSGVYQPPRLHSVPFELDNEAQAAKERRLLQKQLDKQSRSELTAVVRSQFTDAPEVEDARGGAMLGKQSAASRRIAARDADIQEFEETQMLRLTMGKSEKKARKKMMREELSNLGAIAGGLGGVGGDVDEAFGGGGFGGGGAGEEDEGGRFKTKGMRKRKVERLDYAPQEGGGKRRSKKKGGGNAFQKSLYGRDGGGGSGKKKRR